MVLRKKNGCTGQTVTRNGSGSVRVEKEGVTRWLKPMFDELRNLFTYCQKRDNIFFVCHYVILIMRMDRAFVVIEAKDRGRTAVYKVGHPYANRSFC